MLMLLFSVLLTCEAHVKLLHNNTVDFTLPIRNAPNPAADGTLSTDGPCGGNGLLWGAQGFGNVVEGSNQSLVFAYNGGHPDPILNMIRVAMLCGRLDSDTPLRTKSIPLVSSDLVNASASSTKGYHLWVIIPSVNASVPNGQFCTITCEDERGWGGCVDVQIVPATGPTPAAPNALAGKDLSGTFTFASGQCIRDSPNCCCINGSMTVTHTPGASTASAAIRYDITNPAACNKTTTTNITIPNQVLTQVAPNLASLSGSFVLANTELTFQMQSGNPTRLIVTDDSTTPGYCGINSALFVSSVPPVKTGFQVLGGGSGAYGIAAVVMGVLAVIAMGIVMFFFGTKITDRMSGMKDKAPIVSTIFQVTLFILGTASLASPNWAGGTGIFLGLWSVCLTDATGTTCGNPTDLGQGAELFQTVQALACMALIVTVVGMLAYCVVIACNKDSARAYNILFGMVIFESVCFFLLVCFFGGYYNDNLSGALSIQWGFGLAILAWFWSVLAIPFAKLPTHDATKK